MSTSRKHWGVESLTKRVINMKSTNRCTTFCDFLGIVRKLRRENLNLQETLNLMINPSDSAFLWTASSDVMIDKLYQNVSELYYGRSTWVGCSEEAPTELPMSCGNFSYTVCQMELLEKRKENWDGFKSHTSPKNDHRNTPSQALSGSELCVGAGEFAHPKAFGTWN